MAEPSVIFSHSEHNATEHNLASPIAMTIPGEDMMGNKMFLLKAVGGLTKLEHVAAMIIAQNSRDLLWSRELGDRGGFSPEEADEFTERCIGMAESALRLCAKRQTPKAEKPVLEGVQ